MDTPVAAPTTPISVTELNRMAREALESRFPPLWVCGEISNLTRAPSGHLYFTLKDAGAQVRCTLWRNRAQRLELAPANGMRVEARATVSLYEPRGDYQLNVESLRQAGLGNLHEAFLRLKAKLEAEGLFEPTLKRPIPRYPASLALITSPQAAALRDVMAALARRAPHLSVELLPTPVQGEGAGTRIAGALGSIQAMPDTARPDLVLLVRGGGSLEDLWAFNEEVVARAIRACPVPVIVGVGHETDFTIADFAADHRAATPTAAAELASAGFAEAAGRLAHLAIVLQRAMQRHLDTARQRMDRQALRLIHPRERIGRTRKELGSLETRLRHALRVQLDDARTRLRHLDRQLHGRRPDLKSQHQRLEHLAHALVTRTGRQLDARRTRLAALGAHLEHLSPEAVLARGYSITRAADGTILRDASRAPTGSEIHVQLHRGEIDATVHAVRTAAHKND
ncbi:exodeoxyribonuclease VII large subunit [Nitrogeniibacter mangrovi]|uniref:Exodeoxyribonuclease 7 large subunit n=1 Tax=Nitrogeniibacter mangrovi TaxID=2016596 RepID=A0A6C1B6A8_9RHOO|nr:exodeoxyribonuclease VII large subunit [Nitrogeniibacter mangrovi]QID18248.1 exodeoxyribonuclease VII large subunit [Nitrogeniibacter mangrovi]